VRAAQCRIDDLVIDGLVETCREAAVFAVRQAGATGTSAQIEIDLPGEETLHLTVEIVRVEASRAAAWACVSSATASAPAAARELHHAPARHRPLTFCLAIRWLRLARAGANPKDACFIQRIYPTNYGFIPRTLAEDHDPSMS